MYFWDAWWDTYLLYMPSNFWSKIFVEPQDSRSDAVEAGHEELKNHSLTISQRLEAPMVGQANAMANQVQQTKAIVKELEQRSQSQSPVNLLKTILVVASIPIK